MIVLVNSNAYVGGGETIMSRFATWLFYEGVSVSVFCKRDSYIAQSVISTGVKTLHMSRNCPGHERFEELSGFDVKNTIFIICQMQDFYSLVLTFPEVKLRCMYLCFHPDDFKYFSIYSPRLRNYRKQNLENIRYVNKSGCFYVPSNYYAQYLGLEALRHTVAIPGFELSQNDTLQNTCTEMLAISRFVGFKTGSLLALIFLAREFSDLRVTIIGYGWLEFVLRFWIKVMSVENNVRLVGSVSPEKLGSYIRASNICFAQGTSLLQCVAAGKPTIIQGYSPLFRCFIPSSRCAGVWGYDQDGLGEFYHLRKFDVKEAYCLIKNEYSKICDITKKKAKRWDPNSVFSYLYEAAKADGVIETRNINVPSIPLIKRVIFYMTSSV